MERGSTRKAPRQVSEPVSSLEELVRQAQEQPGIRELMAVHEAWARYERAAIPHRQLLALRRVVHLSNSSVG